MARSLTRSTKGALRLLDDGENVIAAVLLHLGLPMNSVDPEHLRQVQDLLTQTKPLVQAYTSDAYKERLISGQAWVSLGWSGDLVQAADEAKEVNVVVPSAARCSGPTAWRFPKGVENIDLAHAFIDFLLDPEIAARNAQAVHFATPNLAAQAQLPPAVRADARIYPPDGSARPLPVLEEPGPGHRPDRRGVASRAAGVSWL